MTSAEQAVIRTLAFNAAWGYAPTRLQLRLAFDVGNQASAGLTPPEADEALDGLVASGTVTEKFGRLALAGYAEHIQTGREREIYFPRKLRRAKRAAAFLKLLPWVRGVFLCNTTALGQAQDAGDLDLFVVCRGGAIWRTRFFSAAPLALLGMRPKAGVVDPVCLSFFVTDRCLDLAPLMFANDDPYFRHWFLSLLPLYDDGVLDEVWEANESRLLQRHPFAQAWMALSSSHVPRPASQGLPNGTVRRATCDESPTWLERQLKKLQWRKFPPTIRELANKDTRVVINDDVLKFHVDDRRQVFKDRYYEICAKHGVEA